MKSIFLTLYDRTSNKKFNKYFDTEFEKDKFKRKLRYSKKLTILKDSSNLELIN